jgi:hypothetical protein
VTPTIGRVDFWNTGDDRPDSFCNKWSKEKFPEPSPRPWIWDPERGEITSPEVKRPYGSRDQPIVETDLRVYGPSDADVEHIIRCVNEWDHLTALEFHVRKSFPDASQRPEIVAKALNALDALRAKEGESK